MKIKRFLQALPILILFFLPAGGRADLAEMNAGFERTYSPRGAAHLTISNIHGNINVTTWHRKTITVRAVDTGAMAIEDHVRGNDISVTVKRGPRYGTTNFDVAVPPDTSVSLHNIMGKVDIQGVNGHISVKAFDGDVRIMNARAASVEVKVTTGDVIFDGELVRGGSYSMQSMKGDIDVTLPTATSFDLVAKALTENINLSDFISNLSGADRGVKGMRGTYLRGGSLLSLTAFNGRILLRKK